MLFRSGVALSMAQWYPKIAEYDYDGWNAEPYLGREFHGVWGDFDVTLTLDKRYTVAASGYLQNPNVVGHGYSKKKGKAKRGKLKWHFLAPKVHDFFSRPNLSWFYNKYNRFNIFGEYALIVPGGSGKRLNKRIPK